MGNSEQKFKGFKDKGSFYRAKIYAMANIITGNDAQEFVKNLVDEIKSKREIGIFDSDSDTEGVKSLTDIELSKLYDKLLKIVKDVKQNQKKVNSLLGTEKSDLMMTDAQRRKIIRITKYKFNWSIEVVFSKILEFCPELRKKLTEWEIKNYRLPSLYGRIKNKDADKIIRRLEKIEKKNLQNEKG